MTAPSRLRRIAVLPGDGVGPEVLAGPTELLQLIADAGRVELSGPWPVGASAFGELGTGLPEPTLAACDASDAMFFGAAGEHPGVSLDDYRPEHSIIGLRQRYDLRVSIRSIVRIDAERTADETSARDNGAGDDSADDGNGAGDNSAGDGNGAGDNSAGDGNGAGDNSAGDGNGAGDDGVGDGNGAGDDGVGDGNGAGGNGSARPLIVLRNLLGGAYGAASTRTESDGTKPACDEVILTPDQITELAEMACDMVQQGHATSIVSADKANLMATSRLWRSITQQVADARQVPLRHTYVDRMAFELAHDSVPGGTIVLTEGIFGDMLSDLAAGRAGSIALCGSASVIPGPPARGRCVGLFEPVHGSAPRHFGQGRVNPSGAYLALAALLEWFAETADLGPPITEALAEALQAGPLTYDLTPPGRTPASTEEFAQVVNNRALPRLKELL